MLLTSLTNSSVSLCLAVATAHLRGRDLPDAYTRDSIQCTNRNLYSAYSEYPDTSCTGCDHNHRAQTEVGFFTYPNNEEVFVLLVDQYVQDPPIRAAISSRYLPSARPGIGLLCQPSGALHLAISARLAL